MLGFWPLIFLFFLDSVDGDVVESNAGNLSPFCKYAEAVVGAVAPRPLPEETALGLIVGNFDEEETWKPYLTPWATAVTIIVILPLLFVLSYLVYRCVACCLSSDSKPKRKIGLKNALNALLLILTVLVIAFAAIAAYGIITATDSANRMGNAVESFADETRHYVQENCAALENMVGVETNITSLLEKISKSFHEAVADMKHTLDVRHAPLVEKFQMIVSKIEAKQDDLATLVKFFDYYRNDMPALINATDPLLPYIRKMSEIRQITPRDTFNQKVDQMLENIVALVDRRLNEIAPKVQQNLTGRLNGYLAGVCSSVDQLTQPLKELKNEYEERVEPHIVYPYYVVLATAAVLLAVALVSFSGIGYSFIVTNRKADSEGSKSAGPKWLYNFSIGAVLLLLITVPLLTATLFAPLGVATDLVCDPWKNPEKRSDVLAVLDVLAARALEDELVKRILARNEHPISKIVNECGNGTSLLEILKLGQVSELFGAGQGIPSAVPLEFYLIELRDTMLDRNNWPQNGFYNLSYFDLLKDMRGLAASPSPKRQLRRLNQHLRRKYRRTTGTIKWLVAFQKELRTILPTDYEVQGFVVSLTPAKIMWLVKSTFEKLRNDNIHHIMVFADTLTATVEKRVGSCEELERIVVNLRTEVCDNTVDIYNSVWLSFLHIIVIFIPFVVIGGALGRLH
ncbi:unnamed protein product [Bursaphelenchus xylophilus]|nr:unnamed protein product [Bursaphelenchus xylophilus]CAG9126625.1 unnamed protein product [Bursaphelenchus xylophilus]